MIDLSRIKLFALEIDGTLTDDSTWWGGEDRGWLQRYSVRDGEALVRLRERMHVVPLSHNATQSARERVRELGLDARWVGVSDKAAGLRQICAEYVVPVDDVCFLGEGPDDAEVFAAVGIACAVADAHPTALACADLVLNAEGGRRAVEELELRIASAQQKL